MLSLLKDFISLIYPNICLACGKSLLKNEHCICTCCKYKLPKTKFHLDNNNPVSKLFWGRVALQNAASYYQFDKGGKVQQLIHQLKYKGQQEIGVTVGKYYGSELKRSKDYSDVDVVLPVPLHPRKQRKRGYNQSDSFAQGLAKSMDASYTPKVLYRSRFSDTQTKKSRFDRWSNVKSIFSLRNMETLRDKHILLVDDVVTTGSTLEACAQKLLSIPGVKVSVVTMAYAA